MKQKPLVEFHVPRKTAPAPSWVFRSGYVNDLKDIRDHGNTTLKAKLRSLGAPLPLTTDMSRRVTLRHLVPGILDQKSTNTCVAQAMQTALNILEGRDGESDFSNRSRFYGYYYARKLRGWESIDEGCHIRDFLKVTAKGLPHESAWPFKLGTWGFGNKVNTLPKVAESKIVEPVEFNYYRIGANPLAIYRSLAAGFPVIVGLATFTNWASRQFEKTGIVPDPLFSEGANGGHCVCIIGYDPKRDLFEFANSYGTGWGDQGFGYVKSSYLNNPNSTWDVWTITNC